MFNVFFWTVDLFAFQKVSSPRDSYVLIMVLCGWGSIFLYSDHNLLWNTFGHKDVPPEAFKHWSGRFYCHLMAALMSICVPWFCRPGLHQEYASLEKVLSNNFVKLMWTISRFCQLFFSKKMSWQNRGADAFDADCMSLLMSLYYVHFRLSFF